MKALTMYPIELDRNCYLKLDIYIDLRFYIGKLFLPRVLNILYRYEK